MKLPNQSVPVSRYNNSQPRSQTAETMQGVQSSEIYWMYSDPLEGCQGHFTVRDAASGPAACAMTPGSTHYFRVSDGKCSACPQQNLQNVMNQLHW